MPSPESRKGLAAQQLSAPFSLSDLAGLGEPAPQSRDGARGRGIGRQFVDGLIDRVQPESESRARGRTRERLKNQPYAIALRARSRAASTHWMCQLSPGGYSTAVR